MNKVTPSITYHELLRLLAVFVVVFLAAKFGQYLFFEWKTSPAILWPPTGIAFAVVWLWGYKYTVPTFLALLAASLTGPASHLVPAVVTTPLAQVAGHAFGVYLLQRLGFDGTFGSMRNVFVFLVGIVFACMFAPTITTSISILTGNLTTAGYISWSRAWAGYVFSCLILFPFVVSWATWNYRVAIRNRLETSFVAVALLASVYFLFWTRPDSEFSFLLFAAFFIAHFWVCLRFSTRVVTLSILTTTTVGILGLFLSPNPERALNQQLLLTELFLFLVIPIFYVFSALVKERATTIQELQEALEKIDKENTAKNSFIAVLAHELRNPLAPVQTTLEILALQQQGAENEQLIEGARRQVFSMQRLLDDLLDINRVTQGKFQLQIERVNLCEIIERCIETSSEIIKKHNHTIVMEPKCDDSIWLDIDPVRFEQTLVNVINNAAKYTSAGGRITISVLEEDGFVALQVKDNGQGVAEENLDEIFKPFWQLRAGQTRTGGGIGVGLSLTKHIVELHGGSITVESEGLGKGSMFTIRIPYPKRDKTLLPLSRQETLPIPSFRILVTDDNVAAADSLSKLLKMKGHEVRTVYAGEAVFDEVAQFAPDIVLLDIGLPNMSGYDVAKKLREEGFKATLIALSGYGQKEDKEKAMKAGFSFHITKPMTIARFDDYLRTLT